jgi:transposase InsO family protein
VLSGGPRPRNDPEAGTSGVVPLEVLGPLRKRHGSLGERSVEPPDTTLNDAIGLAREFSVCRLTDFTEYETSRGGTWRLSPVVDYATKLCLAAPVSGTTGARDAIGAVEAAIEAAERLMGHSLLEDCVDRETGELFPLTIVTDNGPAYKSTDFLRFIASRPELAHVRTRHHAPETNGVVERFNQTIKYEHLYRLEIPDVITLVDEAEDFRHVYNTIRPHESLDFANPVTAYLAHPGPHLSKPESVQES